MNNIARPDYTSRALSFIDKGLIIALTGQRRVGKSYILRQIKEQIASRVPGANIISINKEKTEYAAIREDADLASYVGERLQPGANNYLLIDEVQDILGFENTLRSLNAEEECQVIVTGSNAKMLSSELSTYLAGRYIDIHVQSLSYREFLLFHSLEDSDEALDAYLTYGGLPHLHRLGLRNEDLVWEYLRNIYSTIVLKDVVQREGLRNVPMFENLMSFVGDNVGQLVSARSVTNYLKSQRSDLAPSSALNYLRSAAAAYIVNKVPRYDIHGKRLLETNDKYYFEDLGLRNTLAGGNRARDIEKLMENAVYLHLKSRGYTVYVGALPGAEVDFVAEKAGRKLYVQVAYLLASPATEQREFGNLLKVPDNYPKYVVTMDRLHRPKDYEGITHMNLRKFLCTDL